MQKALSEVENLAQIINVFDLARLIAEDYLEINSTSHSFQERENAIFHRLQSTYLQQECKKDENILPELVFILRSLPLISSLIQFGSTIDNFNRAMTQVGQLYGINDDNFEQATRLSLLVFAYVIDEGLLRFIGKPELIEGRPIQDLWEEMWQQVKKLLESNQSKLWPLSSITDNLSESLWKSLSRLAERLAKRCNDATVRERVLETLKKALKLNEKDTLKLINGSSFAWVDKQELYKPLKI